MTRKEFRTRLEGIGPDVFNRVIRKAKDAVLDAGCNAIAWDAVAAQATQDDKIDKLLDHFGKEGWDVLLKALDEAVKDATGNPLFPPAGNH